ncbi:hypothetical protein TRVL_09749 [Trypanosoma vivax]|nr:hypothetical protein TRVL_09749 [Trypanosoma vivax]
MNFGLCPLLWPLPGVQTAFLSRRDWARPVFFTSPLWALLARPSLLSPFARFSGVLWLEKHFLQDNVLCLFEMLWRGFEFVFYYVFISFGIVQAVRCCCAVLGCRSSPGGLFVPLGSFATLIALPGRSQSVSLLLKGCFCFLSHVVFDRRLELKGAVLLCLAYVKAYRGGHLFPSILIPIFSGLSSHWHSFLSSASIPLDLVLL